MAIDFLILFLLIISLIINLLALGAFWVTPALRTTANRFVINLLIVNIIGCLILAPTLFLRSNYNQNIEKDEMLIEKKNHPNIPEHSDPTFLHNEVEQNAKLNERSRIIMKNNKENGDFHRIFEESNEESSSNLIVTRNFNINFGNNQQEQEPNTEDWMNVPKTESNKNRPNDESIEFLKNKIKQPKLHSPHHHKQPENAQLDAQNSNNLSDNDGSKLIVERDIRCWSLDLVAALGALSVLLIVGDTWCAITDPLRYHSRISELKAWILIAMTWIFGIIFGLLSAFRETTITTTTATLQNHHETAAGGGGGVEEFSAYNDEIIEENLYNMIFSCVYFVIIILLPFGFVCGMYWRIFSEARENGLRMRQNGSSPLLQSALNLASTNHSPQIRNHHNHNQIHIHTNHLNNLQQHVLHAAVATADADHQCSNGLHMRIDQNHHDENHTIPSIFTKTKHHQNHQNILLTLSTATTTDDLMKRNSSYRHLSILNCSQEDFQHQSQLQHHHLLNGAGNGGIRQVHSSPNLQKSSFEYNNHHVLQLPTLLHHHTQQHNRNSTSSSSKGGLGYMTSIRHRLSNASSLFKYREESRAARISILVVIMFLISYLPYGLLVLLQGRLFQLTNYNTQLAIFVIILSNFSSPFIFAYRNKRVRRGVKRLFNLDPRAKDRQLQRRGILNIPHAPPPAAPSVAPPTTTTNNNKTNFNRNQLPATNTTSGSSSSTTYALNTTCKFLTPHHNLNLTTATGTFLVDLDHCHYIKNEFKECNHQRRHRHYHHRHMNLFQNQKSLQNSNLNLNLKQNLNSNELIRNGDNDVVLTEKFVNQLINDDDEEEEEEEHNCDNSGDNVNSMEKRSILKMVCDSSRKLGCTGRQTNHDDHSDASSDFEIEPTHV